MLVVGVTGGIGSGKSTFARVLAERGAHLIDADAIGHEELRAGTATWRAIVEQFGDEVLAAVSMDIDRKRLAAIVFGDNEKLAALNAIVHPRIVARIADELDALRSTDTIVLLDAALLLETGMDRAVDVVVVVTAPHDQRIKRLASGRGINATDAAARIAAQVKEEHLVQRADLLVVNDGDMRHLERQAEDVWERLIAWPS